MAKTLIRENHIYIGNIVAGSKSVPVKWTLDTGAGKEVEHTRATCGCTVPNLNGDVIEALYNDSTDKSVIEKSPNKAILVTKKLKVYLKDGKPLKVVNPRGVEEYNPDKEHFEISFSTTVVSK